MMKDLSPEALHALRGQLLGEMDRRKKADPVSFFPWHAHQRWVLDKAMLVAKKAVRIVLACGGNRGGKSALGKGIFSDFMRRKSPLATKLRTTDPLTGDIRPKNDTDPVTVWIVPPTLEKARQDWVNPSDGFSIKYWLGDLFIDEKKTPDHVFYSRPPGLSMEDATSAYNNGEVEKLDKTILKSHDQDLLSFEASAVDLCIVDEELQDEAKWNSMLMRVGTSNGSIVMAYTPLHGLTWSYDRYWRPLVKLGTAKEHGPRRWIKDEGDGACVVAVQFGAADNPLATEYAHEIASDPGMSEAEKAARLYGEYGFVEGALVPALSGLDVISPDSDHEIYIIDEMPDVTEWILMTDPNKSYGALLVAQDKGGNIIFVREHLEEAWPDRRHAERFKLWESKHVRPGTHIRRLADPGSAGAHSIVNMADLGLFFENAEKGAGSVSASIKKLRSYAWIDPEHQHPITGEMGAPRLYFHRPTIVSKWKDDNGRVNLGCRLADQISQARQTDNPASPPDTPHKDIKSKLDLFDCARYVAITVRDWRDLEEDEAQPRKDDYTLPSIPWAGQQKTPEFDPLGREFYLPDYF
jgi:hypothetical protein